MIVMLATLRGDSPPGHVDKAGCLHMLPAATGEYEAPVSDEEALTWLRAFLRGDAVESGDLGTMRIASLEFRREEW